MQKIMFNDRYGLTKAVLEGRKTMTRQAIKDENGLYADIRCMKFSHLNEYGNAVMRSSIGFAELVPRYKVGEVVAVAQPYKDVRHGGYPVDSRYDAFREADWGVCVNGALKVTAGENNKMFVRAELMPHQIRITNVRVERLQDISDEDCVREGVNCESIFDDNDYCTVLGIQSRFTSPRDAFAALINKISGKGTWESNPWVFVYEFELLK